MCRVTLCAVLYLGPRLLVQIWAFGGQGRTFFFTMCVPGSQCTHPTIAHHDTSTFCYSERTPNRAASTCSVSDFNITKHVRH